jgi:2-dehydropantoate 2-reductase
LDGRHTGRVARLQQAFEEAGVVAKISADIVINRWSKLLMVGLWSGVGAGTRAPLRAIRSVPEANQLLEMAVREVLAVACGSRAALSDDAVEHALAWLDRHAADSAGNMLKDVATGRPSGLEPRSAQSCGRGEGPCHAFLYSCLLPQELRARGPVHFPATPQSPLVRKKLEG